MTDETASPFSEEDRLRVEWERLWAKGDATLALCRAGCNVRGGLMHWLKGAPTHVFPELIHALEDIGWEVRPATERTRAEAALEAADAMAAAQDEADYFTRREAYRSARAALESGEES